MHFCSMQQRLKRIHNYVFTTFTIGFTASSPPVSL